MGHDASFQSERGGRRRRMLPGSEGLLMVIRVGDADGSVDAGPGETAGGGRHDEVDQGALLDVDRNFKGLGIRVARA